MPIKRPRIDPALLGLETETADQRQSRIHSYQDSAQSHLDRLAEHDQREDTRLRRISQKINSGDLWLDARDLLGVDVPAGRQRLTEDFPTNHENMLTEDYGYGYEQPIPPSKPQFPYPRAPRENAPEQARTTNRRSLQEDIAPTQRNSSGPPWVVKNFLGETRSGDTVKVWKITNTKTGSALDKLFRIESVANRIAMLLNESGDQNDPRALSLINAYDKRDRLLKEARQLEKTADGKPMKTERLRTIRAEINQLDYRLGI